LQYLFFYPPYCNSSLFFTMLAVVAAPANVCVWWAGCIWCRHSNTWGTLCPHW